MKMDKEELLKKLVEAFHYEMDWESKENIDSAMTLCLPIIEEYAQSKVNNGVLDDVNKSTKTCHDPTHSCYPSNYIDGKPNCGNCEYFR